MDKQRNRSVRNKVEKILLSNEPIPSQQRELYKLLGKHPRDYATIRKLIGTTKHKLGKKFTKRDMLDLIDVSVFDFDKKLFDKFKSMTHKNLVVELKTIFAKITTNREPVFDGDFPNMIMSCDFEHSYCLGKKLMIKKEKLNTYLDILAADILNPMKSKYIFSPVFVKNTVNYFKFIIRDNEKITITI
jgi:hypothetical protein